MTRFRQWWIARKFRKEGTYRQQIAAFAAIEIKEIKPLALPPLRPGTAQTQKLQIVKRQT